jgi:hypothetical protein
VFAAGLRALAIRCGANTCTLHQCHNLTHNLRKLGRLTRPTLFLTMLGTRHPGRQRCARAPPTSRMQAAP